MALLVTEHGPRVGQAGCGPGDIFDRRRETGDICQGAGRQAFSGDGEYPHPERSKKTTGGVFPAVGIEFVVLRSNVDELAELANLAAQLNGSRVLVSNVLPYTDEMRDGGALWLRAAGSVQRRRLAGEG